MSRIYTKKDNKWNIYSTIIDDFLFDRWVSYDVLEKWVIQDIVEDKKQEIKSLLTDKPVVNYMSYEELIKEYMPKGEENESN